MPTAKLSGLVTRFGRGPDAGESPADAELLGRFAATRDEAAFAELVRRHGRLVFGVCRRVTGSHHLAEDAFQAVFVVLAAKAAAIRPSSAVAAWLHGVAWRTALRARTMADRRRRRETAVGVLPEASSPEPRDPPDAVAVLDEEIARLPEHYRAAVVLCELEGVGRKDAARRLGIAEGTLSSRLAAARKALAERLRSRGVGLSAAGLAALFAQAAEGSPSRALFTRAALAANPASIPAPVAALSQGVIRMMFLQKLKLAVPVAFAAIAFAAYTAIAAMPSAESAAKPAALVPAGHDNPAPVKTQPRALAQGKNKLLIFRSNKFELIDPDGKNAKSVVESEGNKHPRQAWLSPDGKHIAIIMAEVGPPPMTGNQAQEAKTSLAIKEADSDQPPTDLKVACKRFAWSPDGTEIACADFTDQPRDQGPPKFTHVIVNVKTGKQTPLPLPENHLMTDWSRDGKSFLTTSFKLENEKPSMHLHLMNRDGSERKLLTPGKENAMVGRLSPEGQRVLCFRFEVAEETPAQKKARQDAGGKEPQPKRTFALLDVATGKLSNIEDVPVNGEIQGFCWSPDGKKIAYTWRVNHEGKPEDLIQKETESHLVICDPEGKNQKTILTEKGEGQWHITLGEVDWR